MFHEEVLVGFATQFGNLLDVGGQVFGSMPAGAVTIFDEGVRFPPVKLYARGVLNNELLKVLARNSRAPEAAIADVMALCTATALGEQRILESATAWAATPTSRPATRCSTARAAPCTS